MSSHYACQRKDRDTQPGLRSGQGPKPLISSLPPAPKSLSGKWRPAQQTKSAFFQLPAEIRDLILREAFGDRTIHIDLRPRHVENPSGIVRSVNTCVPRESGAQMWRRRARRLVPGLSSTKPSTTSEADDSEEGSPAWGWYSCFCHEGPSKPLGEGENGQVGVDCLFSNGCRGRWEPAEPDQLPREARIGVMGFLLSCKRACDEALRALYATNTFSIDSPSLFLCLLRQDAVPGAPRLTGPSTQLITSLRVSASIKLWIWGRFAKNGRQHQDRDVFAEQLDMLPRAFPNLRRLDWTFSRYTHYSRGALPLDQLGEVEELLLGPLLRASAGMPSLREFVVRIPDTPFCSVMTLEQHRPEPRQEFVGQRLGDIQMWYPFAVRPGEPGPDGGGFWLAYGENQNWDRVFDGTAFGRGLW